MCNQAGGQAASTSVSPPFLNPVMIRPPSTLLPSIPLTPDYPLPQNSTSVLKLAEQMYNWQGSACDLGQKDWQWAPGQTKNGYYYGAVSQRVFQGGLPSGLPNCGSACGQCFDLETTGVNHYNGGIGKGSHIILMVIDACYSSSSEWCKNLTPEGNLQDSAGCEVHFDIQTGPPNGPGTPVNAMGTDGQEWPCKSIALHYDDGECALMFGGRWWSDRKL